MLPPNNDGKAIKYKQKPSEFCKQYNLNLKQVSDITLQSKQTLINWYHSKPELFKVVVVGCAELNKESK